ncbi:MAG: polyprenyl synthetase family protein [Bacteroidaceae bacterium]|nr:polyprenyl synthetase family protein [Bacteroidaceae bacterium]
MYTSAQILEKVNAALAALPYDRCPQGLYAPVRYVLSLGGKRIRPVLMLMGYNLYRDDVESIIMPALGLETYHNYTLLHDDLMDRADVRRGQPTVHKKWNENQAILSGDSMLVLAYQRMAQCPAGKLPSVMALFTETALEIGEGQQYDIEFETRNDVTEDEYIEMIRLKTSVLLACALKLGAMLAGAPESDAAALYDFGEQLGLAFQLQDDYLDVYGDFKVFGKRIGGDILCNKKTYMLINALLHADERQRRELDRWLAATHYDEYEKIQTVTQLYNEIGIPQMARRKIEHYYQLAEQSLAKVNLPEERKQLLWQYAQQMLNRQS